MHYNMLQYVTIHYNTLQYITIQTNIIKGSYITVHPLLSVPGIIKVSTAVTVNKHSYTEQTPTVIYQPVIFL